MKSLPTRERELKRPSSDGSGVAPLSLPTRERELKHPRHLRERGLLESLPTRERELKPFLNLLVIALVGRSLHGSVN